MRSIIGFDDAAVSDICQNFNVRAFGAHGGTRALSTAHYSLTIFVAFNVARAIAYWPQIVRIYRDPGRASAVSVWTWIVFTAANAATVIHALAALQELIVAAVFGVNTISCATIVILTTYKRRHHRPPVWESVSAGFLPEPDSHSVQCERVAIAAEPGKARTRQLRPVSRAVLPRRWLRRYRHPSLKRRRTFRWRNFTTGRPPSLFVQAATEPAPFE